MEDNDDQSFDYSVGVDSEVLHQHMEELKEEIREDYSQNFW